MKVNIRIQFLGECWEVVSKISGDRFINSKDMDGMVLGRYYLVFDSIGHKIHSLIRYDEEMTKYVVVSSHCFSTLKVISLL